MGKYFRFLRTSFSVIRAMQPSTYATFGIVMILWKQFISCLKAVLRVNRQNFDSTVNLTNDYDTVLNFEGTSWFLPFTMPGAENLPKQHCHFDRSHGSLQVTAGSHEFWGQESGTFTWASHLPEMIDQARSINTGSGGSVRGSGAMTSIRLGCRCRFQVW